MKTSNTLILIFYSNFLRELCAEPLQAAAYTAVLKPTGNIVTVDQSQLVRGILILTTCLAIK